MLRIARFVTLALLAPSFALGAKPSLSVDEIVSRHIEARGGYDRIQAIQTMVFEDGVYSEPGYVGSGDAFMAFRRPYFKVVGHPERPAGFMEGWDGSAWEWFEDPGITIRTVGAASGATRRSAEFEGPLVDYRAKGSSIQIGETADIGGRAAYRLVVTTMDGFVREYFIDRSSYLVIAERRSAPFHAYGEPVTTETRFLDYRPVAGVLFPHRSAETVIATGETLTSMRWGSIQANLDLPIDWFSPPSFERTDLQLFLEQLYAVRTDHAALMWTYAQFRRYHPEIDTRPGIELIGYQILKMGQVDQAVALLQANASAYPNSASAAFALGRAQLAAGDRRAARSSFETALILDSTHSRARAALTSLEDLSETGR